MNAPKIKKNQDLPKIIGKYIAPMEKKTNLPSFHPNLTNFSPKTFQQPFLAISNCFIKRFLHHFQSCYLLTNFDEMIISFF